MSNEESETIKTESMPPQNKSPKKLGWLFLLLLMLVFIFLLGAVYYRSITMDRQWSESQNTIAQTNQQLQNNFSELQKNTSAFQQQLAELQKENQDLKKSINDLAQSPESNKNQWLFAKALYYVNLADASLQYENNTESAITLLQLADQIISKLNDPKVNEIRKAFAADITDLQSVPKVDINGMYLKLMALNNKVDQLPLINKPTSETTVPDVASIEQNQSWWKRGWQATWSELKQIVVVRYNQTGKLPLIPPEQQGYLYENIHTMLLQAMWALLHGQSDIYQASLKQASSWIHDYCVTESAITQTYLNDLSQLENINIHPVLPKLTNSLQALEG